MIRIMGSFLVSLNRIVMFRLVETSWLEGSAKSLAVLVSAGFFCTPVWYSLHAEDFFAQTCKLEHLSEDFRTADL